MSRILAIDTATEACSAALRLGEQVRVRFQVQPRRHGELLLGMMQDLLAEAGLTLRQLDGLAFGRGPGAFTGVRIATGVAQGVAYGADLPLLPVSNLAALAQGRLRDRGGERFLCAFDARMGELYWGAFQADAKGVVRALGEEQVAAPAAVTIPAGARWCGVGRGWAVYGDSLRRRLGDTLEAVDAERLCSAQDVATLGAVLWSEGGAVGPTSGLPVYLRDQVAWKKTPA
jgi:tRNA threonylcarbamoyladenosine biosynthesis protein TsaB